MRRGAGLILAAALLLTGCRAQSLTSVTPDTIAGSVETSEGVDAPVDDPSLPHLDSQGRQPGDVLLELIDAANSRDLELAYSLYANPGVDFALFKREREEAQESYQNFAVHETRVIGPGMALVRVTYYVETTPGEGPRFSVFVEEPGEWWRIEMVEGVWRVGWLPRQ